MEEKKTNDHRRKYLADYQRNYTQVKVIIRNDDPEQVEILEWLRTHDDVSGYIKSLIKADMKKTVK